MPMLPVSRRVARWLLGCAVCVSPVALVLSSLAHSALAQAPATPPQIQYLEGHAGPVYAAGYSPDGKLILSASVDGTIKAWDRATGKLVRTMTGHQGPVLSLALSKDGTSIASGGLDR